MDQFSFKDIKPYWLLGIIHALFAAGILLNELQSISNRVPGGNYPIEHQASWARVLLFCAAAVASCFVVWFFDHKRSWGAFFPPAGLVFLSGVLAALASTLFLHYLSNIGWCCESPIAFFFGFPFSFLLGSGGFDYAPLQPFKNSGLLKILFTSQPQLGWQFWTYEFFLDVLFWSSIAFVLLSLAAFWRGRGEIGRG